MPDKLVVQFGISVVQYRVRCKSPAPIMSLYHDCLSDNDSPGLTYLEISYDGDLLLGVL